MSKLVKRKPMQIDVVIKPSGQRERLPWDLLKVEDSFFVPLRSGEYLYRLYSNLSGIIVDSRRTKRTRKAPDKHQYFITVMTKGERQGVVVCRTK